MSRDWSPSSLALILPAFFFAYFWWGESSSGQKTNISRSLSPINPDSVILEYARAFGEEKKFHWWNNRVSIFRWSADLILWAQNVAEPGPEQLHRLEHCPPQACPVSTGPDGCISEPSVTLGQRKPGPVTPHDHRPLLQSSNLYAPQQIEAFFSWLASLISGFHKAKQLFWPNPQSSLHMVGMLLSSLLYIAPGPTVVFLQFDFTKNVCDHRSWVRQGISLQQWAGAFLLKSAADLSSKLYLIMEIPVLLAWC